MSTKSPPSPYWNKKTSLDFICSPTDSRKPPMIDRLDTLPRALISEIGFHLVLGSTDSRGRPHPSVLTPLQLTCRSIHDALSFNSNPKLYNRLFRSTFDTAALTRRYAWMASNVGGMQKGRNIFNLFADPKSWAYEYKERWEMAMRMKQAVKDGILDTEKIYADLWTMWFLITENGTLPRKLDIADPPDGKNHAFLKQECMLYEWMQIYYRTVFLTSSMVPGYPTVPPERGLALWVALIAGMCMSRHHHNHANTVSGTHC